MINDYKALGCPLLCLSIQNNNNKNSTWSSMGIFSNSILTFADEREKIWHSITNWSIGGGQKQLSDELKGRRTEIFGRVDWQKRHLMWFEREIKIRFKKIAIDWFSFFMEGNGDWYQKEIVINYFWFDWRLQDAQFCFCWCSEGYKNKFIDLVDKLLKTALTVVRRKF